jgi:hypothetical protein
MNLDDSAYRPLHGGHGILLEDDDRAFSNVMTSLVPFDAAGIPDASDSKSAALFAECVGIWIVDWVECP